MNPSFNFFSLLCLAVPGEGERATFVGAWHLASVELQHIKLRIQLSNYISNYQIMIHLFISGGLGGLCARSLRLAALDIGKSEPDTQFVKKVL